MNDEYYIMDIAKTVRTRMRKLYTLKIESYIKFTNTRQFFNFLDQLIINVRTSVLNIRVKAHNTK